MPATEISPSRCSSSKLTQAITLIVCWSVTSFAAAQESGNAPRKQQKWAIILVGVPGDPDHEASFRETADQIQKWLVGPLQFPEDHVLRRPQDLADEIGQVVDLTADGIRSLLAEVNTKLQAEDSLWIFTIGHGNYDGNRAWFHVKGRDPSSEEFGRWMAEVRCREQVLWLMHSSSGWFVKPLSRPGRIVIAATAADEEANETEFSYALATVLRQEPAELDTNHDHTVSVSELFSAVVQEVKRRFKSNNRLLTEHSQLDDDGDGVGTEDFQLTNSNVATSDGENSATKKKADGELARRTVVPYRVSNGLNPSPADPK